MGRIFYRQIGISWHMRLAAGLVLAAIAIVLAGLVALTLEQAATAFMMIGGIK